MVAINEDVGNIFDIWFIIEIKYHTWFTIMILVRKDINKWRMCVDFTNLNNIYLKDLNPLPDIDCLINGSSGYRMLSFMNIYLTYNKIHMDPLDASKIAFMSNHVNYHKNVMPFIRKNAGATYQRLMDVNFTHQTGWNLVVYVDDMIVNTKEGCSHV